MDSPSPTTSDAADAQRQRQEPSPRKTEQGSKKLMLSEVSTAVMCIGPAPQ